MGKIKVMHKKFYIEDFNLWGLLVSLCSVIGSIIAIVAVLENTQALYCEKEFIQKDLKTVIRNGGSLDDVKNVFRNRVLIKSFSDTNYYKEDVPLSDILRDLRSNYYLEENSTILKDSNAHVDTTYIFLLNKIIAENEKKNPFDKLEPSQRDNFINLQQKLDTGYVKVSGDIYKIVDEMEDRNQLVTKYLNDSKKSLTISWIALLASIILSLIQIYQNWYSSKKHNKRFDEIGKMINKKE